MSNNLCQKLSSVLANSYSLYLKTQNFHWNVTGSNFKALHDMFQEQYENLNLAIDEIAERIRALGEHAPGGFSEFIQLRTIEDAAVGYQLTGSQMIDELLEDHQQVILSIKTCLELAQQQQDVVTEDMMVERLSFHEKTCWMLKSSL